jgi:hypothetical protein
VIQSQNSPGRSPDAAGRQAGVESVTPLINDLTCKDVYKCRRARRALVDMGEALIEKSDSGWFREGAHHVLFDLSQGSLGDLVKPVLEALENIDSSVEVPFKAKAVLDTMSNG